VTIPDEHVPLIIEALDFRAAYLRACNRDESPCLEVIELLKRKPATKEEGAVAPKKKRA
jgi:hypothetical protein